MYICIVLDIYNLYMNSNIYPILLLYCPDSRRVFSFFLFFTISFFFSFSIVDEYTFTHSVDHDCARVVDISGWVRFFYTRFCSFRFLLIYNFFFIKSCKSIACTYVSLYTYQNISIDVFFIIKRQL